MELDTNLMLFTYYKNFFPVNQIVEWLELDEFREISFCLRDDKYLRYLTFHDAEEFHAKLISTVPLKIDIGAIYNVIPAKNISKEVVKRELVFDIDLTDYERNCCEGKMVCHKCVILIKVAVEILSYSLRYELGFKNFGFVFSGRRGLHCWVNDKSSKEYLENERAAIIKYFETCCEKNIFPDEYTAILEKYSEYMDYQNFEDVKKPYKTKDLYKKMFIKLDKNVTVSHIHLIKMPFCIHPGSGRLSVPIDPEEISSFSIEDTPTLECIIKNPNILKKYIRILESWLT